MRSSAPALLWSATSGRRPGRSPGLSRAQQPSRMWSGGLTAAFEAADVDGIVALLADDAWFTMPPLPLECQGRDLAARFLRATAFRPDWTARLIPAWANRQPAFGFYARDPRTREWHTVGLLVLTFSPAPRSPQ